MRKFKFEDYYNVKSFVFKGKKYKRGVCKNDVLGDFKSRHFFDENADMDKEHVLINDS